MAEILTGLEGWIVSLSPKDKLTSDRQQDKTGDVSSKAELLSQRARLGI